ncbi:MAG: glutamate--cysteine ligase [Myxococcales bacterium]|nr:MAG: glutamate--cysteine ligase [Myxococcales bacterium]
MIVDQTTLCVRPIADRLLAAAQASGGGPPPEVPESEIERGALAWSNELALHLVELKTNGPAVGLAGLAAAFQTGVREANEFLRPLGARLMPTGMHPWMDPASELVLWPHEDAEVYRNFDRIFGCREHGWANLQSMHLNLPFYGDREFGRLHAAIRVLLPILPALAASSPLVEGRPNGALDSRLEFYREHARRIPSLVAEVIPEPVFDRAGYEERIYARIRGDLAAHDPQGTMRSEWMNARGAIARFDRGAIEIRLLDVQECPLADMAVAAAVVGVLRALVSGALASEEIQRSFPHAPLAAALRETAMHADEALLHDEAYLRLLGWKGRAPCRAGDLWRDLVLRTCGDREASDAAGALAVILDEGCLARRILGHLGAQPGRERQREVYEELCRCLDEGRQLRAA